MKEDKEFESKILKYLNILKEQTPEEEAGQAAQQPAQVPAVVPQPQANQNAQAQQPQAPQAQEPKQLPGYNTQKIQFYATPVLFHTQYPPNSSDWSDEIGKKPWFRPMQDGRIGQFLAKLLPDFKVNPNKRSGAARYSDYQFRVILRGEMTAGASIDVKLQKGGNATATLTSIDIKANKVGSQSTFKGDALSVIKPIKTSLDPDIVKDLQKRDLPPEDEEDETPKKPSKNIAPTNDEIRQSRTKSVQSFFRHDMNLDDKQYNMAIAILQQLLAWQDRYSNDGFDAQEVVPFDVNDKSDLAKVANLARKAVKADKTAEDASDIIASPGGFFNPEASKKGPETQQEWAPESFELSKYIQSLNEVVFPHSKRIRDAAKRIRKHGIGELSDVEGGHIIEELNALMLKNWFPSGPDKGIAAASYQTVFRDKLYEFFDVEDVTFRPLDRKLSKNDEGIDISFNGQMVMEAEVWFDCRVGENGDLGSWTFRVFNPADGNKVIAHKRFATQGIGAIHRAKAAINRPKVEQ